MFNSLSDRLTATFKNLRGKGRLSEADIDGTAREIRRALLDADVAVPVVREFIAKVKARALGSEVSEALNPGQQVVKIVNEELVGILGGETRELQFAKQPPTVIMLAGLQGAGKTTLMKLLAGVTESDTGGVIHGHGLKLGYFAQEHDTLDTEQSVLANMKSAAPFLNDTDQRKILGSFLFTGDDVDKPAGVLSGGEKTRLALATLVASQANVLLLDEPTNNLDPASREEILAALRTYEGAVVLISHDPGAVEALDPERVLLLPDGVEDLYTKEYEDLITLE